jgi:hypothetical protein
MWRNAGYESPSRATGPRRDGGDELDFGGD